MSKSEYMHIRVSLVLKERFEKALEAEGLTKTHILTAAIIEYCEKVESKQRPKG